MTPEQATLPTETAVPESALPCQNRENTLSFKDRERKKEEALYGLPLYERQSA